MASEYTQMLLSLFGVIALMLGCFYVLKKFKHGSAAGNKQIKIINAVSIGAKEKLLLVEVNNTVLLIGATPNHIETLHILSGGEVTQSHPVPNQTFAETLETLDKQEVI